MRSHLLPIAGAIIAYAISGCCGDDPDLCGRAAVIIDAGVAAAPCWTAERAPLRTAASVSAPVGLQILGCARISEGDCVRGAAGPSWGQYDRRHHAPAGAWITTARGEGCPGEDCAITVGRAEAVIAARAALHVERPAEIEYRLRCDPPPGRPPLPMGRDPRTGAAVPGWLAACLADRPFTASRLGNGRWALSDVEALQRVHAPGHWRPWTGVERAGAVAELMACTQQQCAALNTWSEPARDLDRDGVQARCDVCPTLPDPGQADRDGDGAGDVCDVCPAAFDPWQRDQDGDGIGDVCDVCPAVADDQRDADGDGFGDACDVCPTRFDPAQVDRDGDGFGDVCDVCRDVADVEQADGDGDGVGDACDNCPALADVMQVDTDADGDGDLCDEDDDDDGLSDDAEAEAETDPLDPDSDDDGHLDGADNCPNDANPLQADADEDGEGDACADRDDDGVLDADDNCVAVANPAQADADEDGIGDACCGDDDPDDDDVPNCSWYPEGHAHHGQPHGPTFTDEPWTSEWPGAVSCTFGRRACRPQGEPIPLPEGDEAQVAMLDLLNMPRPEQTPIHQRWPPIFDEISPENLALGRCAALENNLSAAWTDAHAPFFTLEDYDDCIAAEVGAEPDAGPDVPLPAAPWEVRRPARFGFGIYGEKWIYLTMGYARQDECQPNLLYRVQLDGRRRKGEIDIVCTYDDHAAVIEVKWYNTHRYWPPDGRRAFNDQVRRQFAFLDQRLGGRASNRWQMIFGFRPPSTIRQILDHTWYGAGRDGLILDHPVIGPTLLPAGLPSAWARPHTWYQVNRGDFSVSRVLPLLDEAPCTICSLEDMQEVAASPACEWTQAQLPGVPIDVQLSSDAPYFPPRKARAWLAEYARRCVRGVADCGDGLQYFYDLMACQEF